MANERLFPPATRGLDAVKFVSTARSFAFIYGIDLEAIKQSPRQRTEPMTPVFYGGFVLRGLLDRTGPVLENVQRFLPDAGPFCRIALAAIRNDREETGKIDFSDLAKALRTIDDCKSDRQLKQLATAVGDCALAFSATGPSAPIALTTALTGREEFLSTTGNVRFWSAAQLWASTISQTDATVTTAEKFDAFKEGAKEGFKDVAETAGSAAGEVSETFGEAVGRAFRGFFSNVGVAGLALITGLVVLRSQGWL